MHELRLSAQNGGAAVAQIVVGSVKIPKHLLVTEERGDIFRFDNHELQRTGAYNEFTGAVKGNPQWMPILPSLSRQVLDVELSKKFCLWLKEDFTLSWIVYCDTAPPREGSIKRSDIEISMSESYREFEKRLPH